MAEPDSGKKRAGFLLQKIYAGTRRSLDGSPRERSIRVQELVDDTLNGVDNLIRSGSTDGLDALLSDADVQKVHPEALDIILALVEDMTLPSVQGFRDRASGRIAKVDEVIKPMVLRRSHGQDHDGRAVRGQVISNDVRKDARALYRERAKAFGDALRRDGNLDGFYKTEAMRKHARDSA